MRWTVVLFAAAVLLGLDQAVRHHLAIGHTVIAPSFTLPLVVFIALFAPPLGALWTALLVGLVIDLASPRGAGAITVAGPYALGYLVAAYFVLTVRALMYRRNPLTLMVLSIIACAMAEVIIVTILKIRTVYSDAYVFSGFSQLAQRLLGALYTGVAALVMSFVLFAMMPIFGFHDPRERRFGARK
ncbi:MAG: rod shape-determining protein MreD [Phycisphaeraceae bacterium]|nr:rod shape-determining protein MreD [Phycisphaeraceae bacterium]